MTSAAEEEVDGARGTAVERQRLCANGTGAAGEPESPGVDEGAVGEDGVGRCEQQRAHGGDGGVEPSRLAEDGEHDRSHGACTAVPEFC